MPPPSPVPELTADERFSGGDATVLSSNDEAFGLAPGAITSDFTADANFKQGNAIFRNDHEGQGPLLNAATCQGCHIKDGRGSVPDNESVPMDAMSIALSIGGDDGAPQPDPNYGGLLHVFGLDSFTGNDVSAGLARFEGGASAAIGEGFGAVRYEEVPGQYDDGSAFSLRRPSYRVRDLAYGAFDPDIRFSPRVAPAVFGMGLLEAIADADIAAGADPDDLDGDGISGRTHRALDPTTNTERVARFGLKATRTSVLAQTAGAYRADMGVTNRYFTEEDCTATQTTCLDAAAIEPDRFPGGVDIEDVELALVEFYVRHLAVPARRGFDADTQTWDDAVVRGREQFFELGCGRCHQQQWQTASAPGSVLGSVELSLLFPDAPENAVLSRQTIYPYTDLLLHDMGGSCAPIEPETEAGDPCGAGENCVWVQRCEGLADDRPQGSASGTEWRTPPLWGLGLVKVVNPGATFLHDGRARTIEEAVLWHGGEAAAARADFVALADAERADLLTFLESL
ncbi:MAG: di-heme oxidoredictase family protein [Pseudomonadota bacterium]